MTFPTVTNTTTRGFRYRRATCGRPVANRRVLHAANRHHILHVAVPPPTRRPNRHDGPLNLPVFEGSDSLAVPSTVRRGAGTHALAQPRPARRRVRERATSTCECAAYAFVFPCSDALFTTSSSFRVQEIAGHTKARIALLPRPARLLPSEHGRKLGVGELVLRRYFLCTSTDRCRSCGAVPTFYSRLRSAPRCAPAQPSRPHPSPILKVAHRQRTARKVAGSVDQAQYPKGGPRSVMTRPCGQRP